MAKPRAKVRKPSAKARPRAKARTFKEAQSEIFAALRADGWAMKTDLKIPHATSPDGRYRLWFKTQAVYFDFANLGKHNFGDARSMWADDIRKITAEQFLSEVVRHRKHYEGLGH